MKAAGWAAGSLASHIAVELRSYRRDVLLLASSKDADAKDEDDGSRTLPLAALAEKGIWLENPVDFDFNFPNVPLKQAIRKALKLLLLLWKNWTIMKRNWILKILEIVMPIFISAVYIAIHDRLKLFDGDVFVHLVGPLFLALGFCLPVLNLVHALVSEKEEGIKVIINC